MAWFFIDSPDINLVAFTITKELHQATVYLQQQIDVTLLFRLLQVKMTACSNGVL